MGVGETGERPVGAGEGGESGEGGGDPPAQQLERLPHQQLIGVVGDEGAGRAEVEDAAGALFDRVRLLGEVPQVGDDVVPGLALDLRDPREVEQRRGGLEGGDLLRADRQAQCRLAPREQDPYPAPGGEAVGAREDRRHLARRIALVERILRLFRGGVGGGFGAGGHPGEDNKAAGRARGEALG